MIVPCEGQWCRGVVKNWSPEKGIGFIDCPEIRQQYSRDCHLGDKALQSCGIQPGAHLIGSPILFCAELSQRGTPQAAAVAIPRHPAPAGHPAAAPAPMRTAQPQLSIRAPMPTHSAPPPAAAPAPTVGGVWHRGRIKNWNVEKGFGFIDCPEIRNAFGRDCHIGDKVLNEAGIVPQGGLDGTPILFIAGTSPRGTPQATAVRLDQ